MKAESIERLKRLVMDSDLYVENNVIFGLTCPYCGKDDRVSPLEIPERTTGLDKDSLDLYKMLWSELCREDGSGLAVCRFCHNIVGGIE